MTKKLKLAILADCRHQLDLAGHHVVDGLDIDARDLVSGTIAALKTFEGISALPVACQDAQAAPGEPNVPEDVLWGG